MTDEPKPGRNALLRENVRLRDLTKEMAEALDRLRGEAYSHDPLGEWKRVTRGAIKNADAVLAKWRQEKDR